MKKHTKHDGTITFQQYIGAGEYKGIAFDLCVTMRPDGLLLGMPVVNFKDDETTTVTFELEDIVPKAFDFAFAEKED